MKQELSILQVVALTSMLAAFALTAGYVVFEKFMRDKEKDKESKSRNLYDDL